MLKRILGFIVDCIVAMLSLVVIWIALKIVTDWSNAVSVLVAFAAATLLLLFLQNRRRKMRRVEELYENQLFRHSGISTTSPQHNRRTHAMPNANVAQPQKPSKHVAITNITQSGVDNYTVWGDVYEGEKVIRRHTHLGGTIRSGELKGWSEDFFVIADEKGHVWSFDATGKQLGNLTYNPSSWAFGNVGGTGFSLRAKASQYTIRNFNKYCK